eukprot:COSAG06_NODE_14000_length_1198_cov_1.921747_1_plen_108_part_10
MYLLKSACTHTYSRCVYELYRDAPPIDRLRAIDCSMCSAMHPVLHTPDTSVLASRFHPQCGFAASQGGHGGAWDPASCLVTVLEVLLRAGFVASMPGTPEFCPRKDTP